ncbi:MAG: FkbM family methyltransferase [Holosporaceae bacterium]|jgi:FkbM family methyltransferase|nr:FkbM family methyltransferase [Holosporaceae bacterium]
MDNLFSEAVTRQLERCIFDVSRYYADHTDVIKKMNVMDYGYKKFICYLRSIFGNKRKAVDSILNFNLCDFSWLYNKLTIDEDKELLSKIVARRMLSSEKVQLCDVKREYDLFQKIKKDFSLESERVDENLIDKNWKLYLMNMSRYGSDINFFVNDVVIFYSFAKKQYEYKKAGIYPRYGDTVIDAGGCYGDTALVFANMVGCHGVVYSFEMNKSNIQVFEKNCQNNRKLSKIVKIIDKPLYSIKDIEFFVNEKRAGSTIYKDDRNLVDSYSVRSLTIDDFMKDYEVEKLNFIKMDIEGSELEALKGASDSIKKYKPQMALSVYHKKNDLDEIPKFVYNLVPEYKFYLRHHSCSDLETILYCSV